MSDPLREQLLGYLLGALEDSEREALEESLSSDPRLRRELALARKSLEPLEETRYDYLPPPGLAARTSELVAAHARPQAPAAKQPISGVPMPPSWATQMHWPDVVVAVGICVAASLLVLPAIHSSRASTQLTVCRDNLRKLGLALDKYSQHHDGYFPPIPVRGKLAAAGIYAPTLLRDGFLTNPQAVVCPASLLARDARFRIPSLDELEIAAEEELPRLQHWMGGSYGYSLGHMRNGVYQGTKNLRRRRFALVADSPSPDLPGHQSPNHGGRGQNVLFEDGQVKFMVSARPSDQLDDIFVNDDGLVGAGVQPNDSVIVPGFVPPVIYVGSGGGTPEQQAAVARPSP